MQVKVIAKITKEEKEIIKKAIDFYYDNADYIEDVCGEDDYLSQLEYLLSCAKIEKYDDYKKKK